MFLFPYVGSTLERKTWIYAILFPEIQEKEMGLLNKIDSTDLGVPKGRLHGLAALASTVSRAAHAERLCLRGAPCRAGVRSGMASVRSAPSPACEIPGNRPDRSIALHFCSVPDCSSNSAEFKTACVKNFPLVKNRVLLPSQRRL